MAVTMQPCVEAFPLRQGSGLYSRWGSNSWATFRAAAEDTYTIFTEILQSKSAHRACTLASCRFL